MAILPYRTELASGVFVYFGDAVPTSGIFNVGDLLFITNTLSVTPGALYPLCYRCTTASTTTSGGNGGSWTALGSPVGGGTIPTIASAASIAPVAQVTKVSGTVTVNSIAVPAGLVPGMSISIIPTGTFATTISGNIALASTAVVGKTLVFVWDGTSFYPNY